MIPEKEHLEALRNIESSILEIYDQNNGLIDAEVLMAVEALARFYGGKAQGRTVTLRPLRGLSGEVATKVQETCEYLMTENSENALMTIKTLPEIADCLKVIQSSIKFWTKQNGRQGYLNYIRQFF
ncbi:MAG TPA: hypothetical protein VK184_19550 [Nostocaceae cyanobacterium]|nr:hypothetical protein [Nostocaceae cyanobacterium]